MFDFDEWDTGSSDQRRYVTLPRCLTVLTASEQKVLGGEWTLGTRLSGLPTVRAIVNAVIRKVLELDEPQADGSSGIARADHWQYYQGPEELVAGPTYPTHSIISVDGVATINDVQEYMNKLFSEDRARFPQKNGWLAMAAHHEAKIKLNKDHPFFRYGNTGVMDAKCCRFLIVDEMAIEGMNNRHLCVWGVAEHCTSVRRALQRIGRLIRSTAMRRGGKIIVPPASHDQIYIITHEGFEAKSLATGSNSSNVQTIVDAISFLKDMPHATADVPTLDEYSVTESSESNADVSLLPHLPRRIRCAILAAVGHSHLQGVAPRVERLVKKFGGETEAKKSFVRAYAESAIQNATSYYQIVLHGKTMLKPVDAIADFKDNLTRFEPPEPGQILEAEHMEIEEFGIGEAKAWLEKFAFGPGLARYLEVSEIDKAAWLKIVNQMHSTWEGQFDQEDFEIRETPAQRLYALADEIAGQLNLEESIERIRELVYLGAASYLNSQALSGLADLEAGGCLCVPAVTFALRVENFVSQLHSWVTFMLLKEGLLTDLMAVCHFERFWENAGYDE